MMEVRTKRKKKKSEDGAMLVSIMQEAALVDEVSENYEFVTGLQDPCLHRDTMNIALLYQLNLIHDGSVPSRSHITLTRIQTRPDLGSNPISDFLHRQSYRNPNLDRNHIPTRIIMERSMGRSSEL